MSDSRAKKIKLLIFDVDGVLTDGTIWLFPAPAGAGVTPELAEPFGAAESLAQAKQAKADAGGYAVVSQNVVEAKGFHAHDGTAISLARLGGLKIGIITKRISETVALRARDLRLDYVRQGAANKIAVLDEILEHAGLRDDQAAYVGDDIIDLPVMHRCGLAIAVPNAREEIKRAAHYVTEHRGGEGAARDAVEYILRAQGTLEEVVAKYVGARTTGSRGMPGKQEPPGK
jgi:3-deoxy-D-manno-octulosonate 8-phosphate phosphatase (KDO 8-P phosphatase)